MSENQQHRITQLLLDWRGGDAAALEALTRQVYDDLHRIAQRQLRGERPGHTLQPTALVNEAYARLLAGEVSPQNRAHLLAVAARTMRRILIDHARATRRQKRGGDAVKVTLSENLVAPQSDAVDIIAVDDALTSLHDRDAQKSDIFELHFFGGLTRAEIAAALSLSPSKVHRELTFAKAWLSHELGAG